MMSSMSAKQAGSQPTKVKKRESTKAALEARVREGTSELSRTQAELLAEISKRKRLEKEIARIIEHERRRFGQDLHDDLCQQLAGIALHAQSLSEELAGKRSPEASRVAYITGLVNQATEQARNIALGLHPVDLDRDGLVRALETLVAHPHHGTLCTFEHDDSLPALPAEVALELYRIAQEALTNALKHARASRIAVQLRHRSKGISLIIEDDGKGLPKNVAKKNGMGLHIMAYRSSNIGAALTVEDLPSRGTRIQCLLPLPKLQSAVLPKRGNRAAR
jgi:signal transduction histidine kinase